MLTRAYLALCVPALLIFAGCSDGEPLNSNDAEADLRQLFVDLNERTYTATYSITSEMLFGSDPAAGENFILREIRQGPNRARFTVAIKSEGVTYSQSVISTPERLILCSDEAGPLDLFTSIADHTCIDLRQQPGGEEFGRQFFSPTQAILEAEFSIVSVRRSDVGTEQATCYQVAEAHQAPTPFNDATNGGNHTYCWSNDGRLIAAESVNTSEGNRRLIDYSGTVAADAFEQPYPFLELQTLEVSNETDVLIYVFGFPAFEDGLQIPPHEKATLSNSLARSIEEVYVRSAASSQWDWGCSWEDAKVNEPLVVSDERANCADISPERDGD